MPIFGNVNGELVELSPEQEEIFLLSINELSEKVSHSASEIIASVKLQIISEGVSDVGVDSGFAFAMQLGTGMFYVVFAQEQPDTNYIVNTFDGGLFRCYVAIGDQATDSFMITTTDLLGNLADPVCISVIVVRTI